MARKLGLTPHRAAASRPSVARRSPAGRRPLAHPPAVCPAASQSRSLPSGVRPSHNDHSILARDAVAPPPALLSPSPLPPPSLSRRLFDVARPSRSSRSLLFPSSLSLSIPLTGIGRRGLPLPPSFRRRSRSPLHRPSGLPPSPSLLPPSDRQQSGARRRRGRRDQEEQEEDGASRGGRKSLKGPRKSPEAIHGKEGTRKTTGAQTDRRGRRNLERTKQRGAEANGPRRPSERRGHEGENGVALDSGEETVAAAAGLRRKSNPFIQIG